MAAPAQLERLYDAHKQALFAFLMNLTRNEADTRDVLQELFQKLASEPQILSNVKNERAYLARLTHNLAIDLMRRNTTRHRTHDRMAAETVQLFAPTAAPDEKHFREHLSKALGSLPPEQRAVVHLKLWEEWTFEDISCALDIPLNTAASRYRYGLDKLRELLRPIYNEVQNER